tara:strand:+ start:309 stop:626 length:318 start_codon:yes stop_codon:yes gene_type:complete
MKETFAERVVDAALAIPAGKVATYGDLAKAAGGGGQAARSVTSILSKAHHRGVKNIPFHRMVFAGGRVWVDSRHFPVRKKMFKQEGIEIDEKGRIQNFPDHRMKF